MPAKIPTRLDTLFHRSCVAAIAPKWQRPGWPSQGLHFLTALAVAESVVCSRPVLYKVQNKSSSHRSFDCGEQDFTAISNVIEVRYVQTNVFLTTVAFRVRHCVSRCCTDVYFSRNSTYVIFLHKSTLVELLRTADILRQFLQQCCTRPESVTQENPLDIFFISLVSRIL
jgi:hypothetical protein